LYRRDIIGRCIEVVGHLLTWAGSRDEELASALPAAAPVGQRASPVCRRRILDHPAAGFS